MAKPLFPFKTSKWQSHPVSIQNFKMAKPLLRIPKNPVKIQKAKLSVET